MASNIFWTNYIVATSMFIAVSISGADETKKRHPKLYAIARLYITLSVWSIPTYIIYCVWV